MYKPFCTFYSSIYFALFIQGSNVLFYLNLNFLTKFLNHNFKVIFKVIICFQLNQESLIYLNLLLLKWNWGKNLYFLVATIDPLSQTPNEFDNYCQNFHLTLSIIDDTPIATGDCNVRCRDWWAEDLNSNAGKELESLTSRAGFTQLTDKPTF